MIYGNNAKVGYRGTHNLWIKKCKDYDVTL